VPVLETLNLSKRFGHLTAVNKHQLPFTCAYTPGRRPPVIVLAGWIAVLGALVPVLSIIIAAASQIPEIFAICGAFLLAITRGCGTDAAPGGAKPACCMKIHRTLWPIWVFESCDPFTSRSITRRHANVEKACGNPVQSCFVSCCFSGCSVRSFA
jgi:hypothetical protein